MENPIKPCALFAAPKDLDELYAYMEKFSGSERTVAVVIMGMTWNLAHKIFEEALNSDTTHNN